MSKDMSTMSYNIALNIFMLNVLVRNVCPVCNLKKCGRGRKIADYCYFFFFLAEILLLQITRVDDTTRPLQITSNSNFKPMFGGTQPVYVTSVSGLGSVVPFFHAGLLLLLLTDLPAKPEDNY